MSVPAPGWVINPPVNNRVRVNSSIPIDLATTTFRIPVRLCMGPVSPGDKLLISAESRVTNDNDYNVGIGWGVWVYDYSNPLKETGPWTQVSPMRGENVTPDMHHMPLQITTLWEVPADWPEGHRPFVVMRADAHSTAWNSSGGNDTISIDDGYSELIVTHWAKEDV